MGFLTGDLKTSAVLEAEKHRPPPPPGAPHSVALPGSKIEGRSEVYRHWRFTDGLLSRLDPAVYLLYACFNIHN